MDNQKNHKEDKLDRMLNRYGGKDGRSNRDVIYGLYDSSRQSIFTRLNDWLVDHTRVPLDEKVNFFNLLAVMADSGIPLITALKILSNRTRHERFRRIVMTIAYNVVQGKKFSESLAGFPGVFTEMEIGVIKAGEAAGNLDKMLFKLSEQLEKSQDLQIKIITASVYPAAVFVVLLAVASGMLVFVIPSLTGLLKEGGLKEEDFPFATLLLMSVSGFIANYWWLILIGLVFFIMFFRIYKTSEGGRFRWDLFKLRVPVVGPLIRKIIVLRFIGTLGILMEAGLPVVQALSIIATSMTNEIYKIKIWEVIAKVQQGKKISQGLSDVPFLFPETVTQMLSVAEQTASMGKISQKIAAHYDREIDNSLKRLTSLFEPIMIIMVGVVVALLALAILTPIFKLSSLV